MILLLYCYYTRLFFKLLLAVALVNVYADIAYKQASDAIVGCLLLIYFDFFLESQDIFLLTSASYATALDHFFIARRDPVEHR